MRKHTPFFLSAIILALASIYFIIIGNKEFLVYAVTLAATVYILIKSDDHFKFLPFAKWGFLIWMAMHMAGGFVYINGTRLYDLILVPIFGQPLNILKYDQFVHFSCYVVITLLVYSILLKITVPKPNKVLFSLILVLAASALGAINEIIEFSAVLMFESEGVGGYYNNSLDLIFNLLGAVVAIMILRHSIKGNILYKK